MESKLTGTTNGRACIAAMCCGCARCAKSELSSVQRSREDADYQYYVEDDGDDASGLLRYEVISLLIGAPSLATAHSCSRRARVTRATGVSGVSLGMGPANPGVRASVTYLSESFCFSSSTLKTAPLSVAGLSLSSFCASRERHSNTEDTSSHIPERYSLYLRSNDSLRCCGTDARDQ
jgi:hypothetical protein